MNDSSFEISREEHRALDEVRRSLRSKFPAADTATVEAVVTDAHRKFDGRSIRDFVPLFVERSASAALSAHV